VAGGSRCGGSGGRGPLSPPPCTPCCRLRPVCFGRPRVKIAVAARHFLPQGFQCGACARGRFSNHWSETCLARAQVGSGLLCQRWREGVCYGCVGGRGPLSPPPCTPCRRPRPVCHAARPRAPVREESDRSRHGAQGLALPKWQAVGAAAARICSWPLTVSIVREESHKVAVLTPLGSLVRDVALQGGILAGHALRLALVLWAGRRTCNNPTRVTQHDGLFFEITQSAAGCRGSQWPRAGRRCARSRPLLLSAAAILRPFEKRQKTDCVPRQSLCESPETPLHSRALWPRSLRDGGCGAGSGRIRND
jgi:hypothetical protein